MELPPELICEILYYLHNKEYWHCYNASKLFHVSSRSEYDRRKIDPLEILKIDTLEIVTVYARLYRISRIMSGNSWPGRE